MSDQPSIFVLLVRAMNDVKAVGKSDKNTFHNFMYRGVDTILYNVGPVLRAHGVIPVPTLLSLESRDTTTEKGKTAREITITVKYTFYGPNGDFVEAVVPGESQDTGDKAVSKAMSVAMRTAFIQVFAIPTREKDPDSQTYVRDGKGAVVESVEVLKRGIWAAAQERGWIGEDKTYQALADDFAEWCAQDEDISGPVDIAQADAVTLRQYLDHLKPPKRMARARRNGVAV